MLIASGKGADLMHKQLKNQSCAIVYIVPTSDSSKFYLNDPLFTIRMHSNALINSIFVTFEVVMNIIFDNVLNLQTISYC